MSSLWEAVAQSVTYREIMNQSVSWTATLGLPPDGLAAVAPEGADLLFTGCGSSYYLAQAAAGLAREALGVAAGAVPASDILLVPEQVFSSRPVRLIAFSRSGETSETVAAVRAARSRGQTVAVTCAAGSSLSAAADRSIALAHANDESVVMTQSYTNMLLAILCGCAHAAGSSDLLAELRLLPEMLDRGWLVWKEQAEALAKDLGWRQAFFFGTGAYYGLAAEAALKLKEMCQATTEAYQPLEFRHGPMSLVNSSSLLLLLERDGSRAPEQELMAALKSRGAQTVTVGPQGGFALGGGSGDWARSPLYLPPLQLLALARCLIRGLNPDQPRGLTRVVTLRKDEVQL